MKRTIILGLTATLAIIGAAKADPVDLSAYADANGFIDVQKLTCAQLATPIRRTLTRSQAGTAAGTTASPTNITWTTRRAAKSSTR